MTKGWENDEFDMPGGLTIGGDIQSDAAAAFNVAPTAGQVLQLDGSNCTVDGGVVIITGALTVDDIDLDGGLIQGTAAAALNIAPTTGQVLQLDGSNCTVDGGVVVITGDLTVDSLNFNGATIGFGATGAIVINTIGSYTSPLQSKFLAYNDTARTNVTGDGTNYTLPCEVEVYDQNADYNVTTFTYTAPLTSRCSFGFGVKLDGVEAAHRADNSIITSNSAYTFQEWAIGVIKDPGSAFRIDGHVECDMDSADTATMLVIVAAGTKSIDLGTTANNVRFYGGIIA